MVKKHLELKTYNCCGIEVLVKINYDKGQISLCESIPHPTMSNETTFQDKKWVFAKRGLEYMASWKDVLHAMEYAIDQASKEIRDYVKEVEKENENSICEIMDIASEIVKGQRKIKKVKKYGKNK